MFVRVVATAALLLAPLYAQVPAKQNAPAAAALPDAREIINRHVKEIGGREAVLSHKSMHAVGSVSIPSNGMNGSLEIFGATAPDRVVVKTSMPGIGDIQEGYDGSHAWTMNPMTGPMLKVGKELDQQKLDADFYSELRDPAKYPTVKTVEKTMFEGRECYKVAVTRADGSQDFDFYDVATGLRAGGLTTRETPMGTVMITSVASGYKKFGNLLQATTSTMKFMGVEQVLTLTSIEYDKVDPSVFEPPAAIKALIK